MAEILAARRRLRRSDRQSRRTAKTIKSAPIFSARARGTITACRHAMPFDDAALMI